MDIQKPILIRILIVGAVIYAAWNFGLRPKIQEEVQLQETRSSQVQLISESGMDFDARQLETENAHRMISSAGNRIIETLSATEDHKSARDLINASARAFGVDVNRVEPLRVAEFSSASTKNRSKNKNPMSNANARTNEFVFKGEGIRVEFEGTFAGIAGFLQQLELDTQTLKLENFRMVSSTNGGVRMIAQFMKFELTDAPIALTQSTAADTSIAMTGDED
jgi:hypothetical protein